MTRVGIVGAGLIGRAWAQVFARGGCEVLVWDPSPAQRDTAIAWIERSRHDLARHGLVADPAGAARRVATAPTLEAVVAGADYVQESGPEVVDVKRATFAALDAAARPDAILASSTSAIVASQFTESLPGRARCLVAQALTLSRNPFAAALAQPHPESGEYQQHRHDSGGGHCDLARNTKRGPTVQRKQPVHKAFARGARARTALDHHFAAQRIDPRNRVSEPMDVTSALQVIQVAGQLPW